MNVSKWAILANVLVATFLAFFSLTVTIIGNTDIQGELALSLPKIQWVQIFYLLAINSAVPATNWFAERFGYKKIYFFGLLIFSISSGAVAFVSNFETLSLFRFIEGVGGGIIFPIGLALIVQNTPKEQVPLALNLYIAIGFAGGLGCGMLLSGYFIEFFSWRWPLFFMCPLGLLAALHCFWTFSETPRQEKGPFDRWGYCGFIVFVASLLVALTFGPLPSTDEGWSSPFILGSFALAAIALGATILIERRHPLPLLPLKLFREPLFAVSGLALFLLGMGLFTCLSSSTIFMISALKYEKYITGLIASTYGLVMAIGSLIGSLLGRKIPIPLLLMGGFGVLISSYFLNNQITLQSGPEQILLILLLRGLGVGLSLGPVTGLGMSTVPKELKGEAATILTFFRQVGGTYGGTVIGILTIKRTIFHTARFGEQMNAEIPGYQVAWHKLSAQLFSHASDKGYLAAQQAKLKLIQNVETQAFIQAQNDALFVFGYVTSAIALVMAGLILHKWYSNKKNSQKSA